MFKVNDYVIYGGNGVCRVADIGIPNLKSFDEDKIYYTLEPVYETGRIFAPVDNQKVVMRKIIDREHAANLIDSIPDIETVRWIDDMKEREQEFKQIIHQYDCSGFVKIIKTIMKRKDMYAELGKKLSVSDTNYMKKAKEYLDSELAVSLSIPKDMIHNYIKDRIQCS